MMGNNDLSAEIEMRKNWSYMDESGIDRLLS